MHVLNGISNTDFLIIQGIDEKGYRDFRRYKVIGGYFL